MQAHTTLIFLDRQSQLTKPKVSSTYSFISFWHFPLSQTLEIFPSQTETSFWAILKVYLSFPGFQYLGKLETSGKYYNIKILIKFRVLESHCDGETKYVTYTSFADCKTPFYVEKFRFSSPVNWGTCNLICSGDIDVQREKRRSRKSGKGKVRLIYFTHMPTVWLLFWEIWHQNFYFPLICKSLWQTSQTDTVKLRTDKLLHQWHFWYFNVYLESGISVHVIQWKRVMRLYAFQTFSFPQWTVLIIQNKV